MPETSVSPVTVDTSTLTLQLLSERIGAERQLREQSLSYERELRQESRKANRMLASQMALSHQDVHKAESTARDKAAAAVDKRLEGMNEFRDQLRQQASSFLTITVFETWKEENRRGMDDIKGLIVDLQKMDLGSASTRSGERRGQGMVIAAIVGSVSFAAVLLGLIVALSNALTR